MMRWEIAAGAACICACSLVTNLDELSSGEPDGEGSDASADVGTDGCPATAPAMVQTPLGFCVDSTEVTRSQYATFLGSGVSTSSQDAICAFNTSFLPTLSWPDTSNLPVVGVDWCDAFAYCKWAGKRLCGDRQGGAVTVASATDPAHDQWFAACTHSGTLAYPYGNAYDPMACNGPDRDAGGPLGAGSLLSCSGGYAGMYDMSGNVWEWQDACDSANTDSGADDTCIAAGGGCNFVGGLGDGAMQTECQAFGLEHRGTGAPDRGFRCCAP